MTNNWKNIWNKKVADISGDNTEYEIFKKLKRADGFDVAVENEDDYYQSFYNGWSEFYGKVKEFSGDIHSVYEVGCGSGVNLYMFSQRGVSNLGG